MNAGNTTSLGGYRLLGPIRTDALGRVFIADHAAPARREVMRVLAPGAGGPEVASRFAAQTQTLQGVIHPGLGGLVHSGVDAGVLWFTSRYVDGSLLTTDRRSDAQVLAIASLVAESLDHAHRRTVVHGDLAPSQILLASGAAPGTPGSVVVLDVGTIALAGRPVLSPLSGTAAYTAPEVIAGRPAGPPADQYSLACLAYQLLTGTTPFAAGTESDVIAGHLHRSAPALSVHRPDLAAADQVFAHALDKSAARRYPDCRAFVGSVAAALSSPAPGSPAPGSRVGEAQSVGRAVGGAPEATQSLRGRGLTSTPMSPAPTSQAPSGAPTSQTPSGAPTSQTPSGAPTDLTPSELTPSGPHPGAVPDAAPIPATTIPPIDAGKVSAPTLVPSDLSPVAPAPSAFVTPAPPYATTPPPGHQPPTDASTPGSEPVPAVAGDDTFAGSAAPTAAATTPRRGRRRAVTVGLGIVAAAVVAAIAVAATLLVTATGARDLRQVTASPLSSSGGTTCSIQQERLFCWGTNADGKLGNGTTTDSKVPVQVAGLNKVTSVDVGFTSVCAVADSSLYCWGRNGDGQLGDGTTTDHPTPTKVETLTGVSSVTLGTELTLSGNDVSSSSNTCAVADGGAYCWGANPHGQLGDGTTDGRLSPTKVKDLDAPTLLTTDSSQTCALTAPGDVYCWGANRQARLGVGTPEGTLTPIRVPSLSNVTDIDTAVGTTCAVTDSTLWCWGNNTNGQIGDGTRRPATVPIKVDGLSDVTTVTLGTQTTCAAAATTAYCWGSNYSNAVSADPRGYLLAPTKITGVNGEVQAVSTQSFTTCAQTADSVYCWGTNRTGEVGIGTTDYIDSPVEVTF